MSECRICGSKAVNPHCHGRADGVDLDLCDVCYWRERAECARARVAELEAEVARLRGESAEAWLEYFDEQCPYEALVIRTARWASFRAWRAALAAKGE